MRAFGKFIMSFVGVLVVSTLGVSVHSSMVNSHSGHSSSHARQTLSCSSLYLSVPNGKASDDEIYIEDNDDDYQEPNYQKLLEPISYPNVHSFEAALAVNFEPPPGPPGYILYSVFRV